MASNEISQLELKNFRCFTQRNFVFESSRILIEGSNGTGKTSILEALHYLCYLRSFRTHSPHELTHFGAPSFFIKVSFGGVQETSTLQLGFSGKRRLIKCDNKPIQSYKDLIALYRAITLTQDDLGLIKDGPEIRRSFVDHALLLYQSELITSLRQLKHTVEQRNALLKGRFNQELYELFSEQLWQTSLVVAKARINHLALLGQEVKLLIGRYFDDFYQVDFHYQPKRIYGESYQDFCLTNTDVFCQERRLGRSLFGAHLDDFSIQLGSRSSKLYASRGQQKLIILLIKIAHAQLLAHCRGPVVFLMDDFLTDFDRNHADILLEALKQVPGQIIISTPLPDPLLLAALGSGTQRIQLSP